MILQRLQQEPASFARRARPSGKHSGLERYLITRPGSHIAAIPSGYYKKRRTLTLMTATQIP
jgi:hypothetical protein